MWVATWALTCRWTPKPFNAWRIFVLGLFGARIHGRPFVHGSARIHFPPHLTLHDRACVGEGVAVYCLAPIELHAAATVSQEAFLCTGTHAFDDPRLSLQTAPIVVGHNAFIGARAFVLPGITVGANAVIGACAVVTRDVAPDTVVAGNPARPIGMRGASPAA